MKKIINQPDNYIKEMLEGIYIAHKDDLACVDGDLQVLVSKHKKEGKVGIVTGGGSGHLPLFLGYVGKGMIDGCAVGDVFQSPSVDQAIALTRDADQGAGVLYIYGNYNGDIFTFRPAADEVEMEDDIETAEVLGADDVASAGPSAPGEKSTRRGVAGIFFVYKYYVGEYATAIEMAGFSISLLKLDDELKEYIDHPVDTPFFKQV